MGLNYSRLLTIVGAEDPPNTDGSLHPRMGWGGLLALHPDKDRAKNADAPKHRRIWVNGHRRIRLQPKAPIHECSIER